MAHATLKENLEKVSIRIAPSLENVQWLHGVQNNTHVLSGKVLLVNFWATWCPPCIEELPSIQRAREHFSREDFEVVAVNTGEKRQDIESFLQKLPTRLTFPIVVDERLIVYTNWQVRPLPTTFLVDRSGKIRYQAIGGRNYASSNILTVIQALIDE